MPRQRRRRRGPVQYEGPRRTKLPFPVNLIFNVKFFYFSFIIIMIASMAAVGLGTGLGSSNPTPPPIIVEGTPEPTPATATFADGPAATIDGAKPYVAVLDTNKGQITIKLATDALQAVNSFAYLAGKGFFDGTAIFYVDQRLGALAGDPTCADRPDVSCTGLGGPGYFLPLEQSSFNHVQFAVVAPWLAEGGQEMSGSQFRILLTEDHRLDGKETVFGLVTKGQEILQALPDGFCAIVNRAGCTGSISSALIIEKVTVQPA